MTVDSGDSKFRLFTVTITTEVIVLAENENEATDLAKHESDIDWYDSDYIARPLIALNGDWDLECIPFGEREADAPDRTIGEWIDAGAAPEYVERLKRLQR